MKSAVDIVNLALTRLRVKQRLSGLDDRNDIARTASFLYDHHRDALLESYAWGFATRIEALTAASGDPPPGWGYAYVKPAECIRVQLVTDSGGARYWSRNPYLLTYADQYVRVRWAVPFAILNVDGSPVIATDMPDAYAVYTWQVEDVSLWPESAASALAWMLAVDLGPGLNVDGETMAMVLRAAPTAIAYAKAQDGNQGTPDPAPDSPTIACRD